MKLSNIAVNNLRRRKGRTAFLLLTFLVVVGTTVALNAISTGLRHDLDRKMARFGANVLISPKSEHLALSYGGLSVPGVTYNVQKLDLATLDKLKQINKPGDITGVAPKVIGPVNGEKQKYLVVGVDMNSELRMKTWWKISGAQPGDNELVIGSRLAMRDKIGPGQTLKLSGSEYRISGVLEETGGSEDNTVFTNIETARRLTGLSDSYTLIEVNAKNPNTVVAEISSLLPNAKVTPITKLAEGVAESSQRFAKFSFSVSILLGLVGTLVVLVTLAGNVNDRTRELGIFRAIGFRQKHVLKILLTEVLLVSGLGGLGGYLTGIAAPLFLGPLVVKTELGFNWYPLLGISSILVAAIVGVAAIAYPAWKAIKLDPSEALRFI